MTSLSRFAPPLLSVLRVMAGLLVLQHGTTKYLGVPAGPMNNASITTMGGAAGIFELACGVLVIIGLYTRPAAFRGWEIPDVLRSGDHARVDRWRRALSPLLWRGRTAAPALG